MNGLINKLLLVGDKFITEMHLTQPGFTCGACGPFTKNNEKIIKVKETKDSRNVYKNKLDKACFQYAMAYGNFKDLNRGITADKVLHNKGFNIAKNLKYDGCHINVDLLQWFIIFLIKKLLKEQLKMKLCLIKN